MEDVSQIKHSIIEEYKFNYEEFLLSKNQIFNLFGYDDETVPEPILESIEQILIELPAKVNYKSGFKIFKTRKIRLDIDSFIIDNRTFNCGKIIISNLQKSETLGFMIATIGNEISNWTKSLMNSNEILKGYLVDKIASEIIEMVADETELKMNEMLVQFGYKTTNRYSPGYCGWNVSDQQKLFALLPNNFCEVIINENSMMFPIKSISAVIGMGSSVERKDYQCSICEVDFCYKRERDEKNI